MVVILCPFFYVCSSAIGVHCVNCKACKGRRNVGDGIVNTTIILHERSERALGLITRTEGPAGEDAIRLSTIR